MKLLDIMDIEETKATEFKLIFIVENIFLKLFIENMSGIISAENKAMYTYIIEVMRSSLDWKIQNKISIKNPAFDKNKIYFFFKLFSISYLTNFISNIH